MNTQEPTASRGRRWFLTNLANRSALAGLGAITLGRLVSKDSVPTPAEGSRLVIGQTNTGTAATFLFSSPPGSGTPALSSLSASAEGAGFDGRATSPTGPTKGTVGYVESPGGMGMFGFTTAAAGTRPMPIAVAGWTPSPTGTGLNGHAGATSGQTTGTVGHVESPDGVGVFGLAGSTAAGTVAGRAIAVAGLIAVDTGRGVDGTAAAL